MTGHHGAVRGHRVAAWLALQQVLDDEQETFRFALSKLKSNNEVACQRSMKFAFFQNEIQECYTKIPGTLEGSEGGSINVKCPIA